MLIKECKVILHNDLVAVVLFDGKEIQVPNSKLINKTTYVKFENKKYIVVSNDEFEKFCKRNIKKNKVEEKPIEIVDEENIVKDNEENIE